MYEFKCPQCGRVSENIIKSTTDVVYCYNCEHAMERQLSAPYGKVTGYSYSNGYSKKNGDKTSP